MVTCRLHDAACSLTSMHVHHILLNTFTQVVGEQSSTLMQLLKHRTNLGNAAFVSRVVEVGEHGCKHNAAITKAHACCCACDCLCVTLGTDTILGFKVLSWFVASFHIIWVYSTFYTDTSKLATLPGVTIYVPACWRVTPTLYQLRPTLVQLNQECL